MSLDHFTTSFSANFRVFYYPRALTMVILLGNALENTDA